MAHTPGPWKVIEAGGFWIVPDGPVPLEFGGPDITIVPVPLDSEDNANLIAEAPALLAALYDLMSQFIEVYRGDGWVTDRSYLRACEVTDRADGKG